LRLLLIPWGSSSGTVTTDTAPAEKGQAGVLSSARVVVLASDSGTLPTAAQMGQHVLGRPRTG